MENRHLYYTAFSTSASTNTTTDVLSIVWSANVSLAKQHVLEKMKASNKISDNVNQKVWLSKKCKKRSK